MATININNSQTFFDVAILLNGTLDGMMSLIYANPQITNVVATDLTGQPVNYTESTNPIPVYFKSNSITIASKLPIV